MNASAPADNKNPLPAAEALTAAGDAACRRGAAVAEILAGLELGREMLAAGRLAAPVAAGRLALDTVAEHCGAEVAGLVREVNELPVPDAVDSLADDAPPSPAQGENLRKMLLAMVRDVRVMLIRLADQLVLTREARHAERDRQQALARAAREIYAPLANRLGIWQLKWEFEDLAFRFLEPDNYRRVAAWLAERRADREAYIARAIEAIRVLLREEGIAADIQGRPKHLYSIWRKMQRKQVDIDALYDLRAIRVLVETVRDCYAVLGAVHGRWRYVPGEFDDYIATPKENGYRSLHTVVFGPEGKALEIQIRTREMHRQAELGVASHWRYKEGAGHDSSLEERIARLRALLESVQEGDQDFIERFREEIFEDRVYVFTPRGEILDLPAGATPLDFAYYVHTDIGHRCRGARVNGKLTPITQPLKTGDRVEILTAKRGEPSRDWLIPQLGYLATPRARAKVRAWFRQQDHEANIGQGRAILERELTRLGADDLPYERLLEAFPAIPSLDGLFALLGSGDLTTAQLAGAVQRVAGLDRRPRPAPRRTPRRHSGGPPVRIKGVDNLLTQLARCCRPIPPEPITGFITRGRGITIHRRDCGNVRKAEPGRLLEAEWESGAEQTHPVEVSIEARDRHGILRDISAALGAEQTGIAALDSRVEPGTGLARINVTVNIRDLAQLSRLLHLVSRVPGVLSARRALQ